jgi:hypothetical protein
MGDKGLRRSPTGHDDNGLRRRPTGHDDNGLRRRPTNLSRHGTVARRGTRCERIAIAFELGMTTAFEPPATTAFAAVLLSYQGTAL